MEATSLVAVGAIACDIILGVPHYPEEDSKLRATSMQRRRGGNVGNSLEVLQQLLAAGKTPNNVRLSLVAALPERDSPSLDFIRSSFENAAADHRDSGFPNDNSDWPLVDLDYCVYRDGHSEPVTSYIISSEASQSRTIVNHNRLPEMTADEMIRATYQLYTSDMAQDELQHFHFEGRIPDTTLECMRYFREQTLTISVELEKPGREGLQNLAYQADVVFYSRSWAEGEGYRAAEECLVHQLRLLGNPPDDRPVACPKLLVCTWGADGAYGLLSDLKAGHEETVTVVHSPAHVNGPAVDTTGAGDTFIAGMLYQLLHSEGQIPARRLPEVDPSALRHALDFANAVAGQKIQRHGFSDLSLPTVSR